MTPPRSTRPPPRSTVPPRRSDVYTRCEVLLARLRGRAYGVTHHARDLRWMLHRAVELLTPEQNRKFRARVLKETLRRTRAKRGSS